MGLFGNSVLYKVIQKNKKIHSDKSRFFKLKNIVNVVSSNLLHCVCNV